MKRTTENGKSKKNEKENPMEAEKTRRKWPKEMRNIDERRGEKWRDMREVKHLSKRGLNL